MKKITIFIAVLAMILLSGCAGMDGCWEKVLLQQSGIAEDEDYRKYQELAENGELNEDGYYTGVDEIEKDGLETEVVQGQVHVTFAKNGYLTICYYKDTACEYPIEEEECYLNPGECIYAGEVESSNQYSGLYDLAEFRVYEYDADGNRELLFKSAENGLVYQIPADFKGTELSILPIGEYQNRKLFLRDYYIDSYGEEQDLTSAGTWKVDGKEFENGTAKISSLGGYIVTYTYDKENYFYVTSEPDYFSQNSGQGVVQFWEAGTTEENESYSVELHPYLTISIQLDEEGTIKFNDEEGETVKRNKTWTKKLQYGDKILIDTKGGYEIIDGDYQYIQESVDPLANGVSRYTLRVIQEAAQEQMVSSDNRSLYTVTLNSDAKYGECIYMLDKEEVSGKIKVKEGQKLTLTYTITSEGYEFKQRSDGIVGFFKGILNSTEQTIEIPITAELDGMTIYPDEKFTIGKKKE